MIRVKCALCKEELDDTGALLFGPPTVSGMTQKLHFCDKCFMVMMKFLGF